MPLMESGGKKLGGNTQTGDAVSLVGGGKLFAKKKTPDWRGLSV
jgi:hypothetical protein